MYNENQVSLIGNVGKVEIRSSNGTKYAIINLATNERWTDKQTGEIKERADWHRLTTFRPKLVALIEQHVGKGDFIRAIGKLRSGSYDKAGETVYTVEIHMDRIGFLSPKDAAPDTDTEEVPF